MAEVSFIINKIVLQVAFTFIDSDWLLLIVIFLGACLMAYYNIIDDPYYNKSIGTFYKVLNLCYLWSNFVILILKIIEPLNFHGGIVVWLIGIPFLFFVAISLSQTNLQILIKSQMKFESPNEILDHLKMILLLIERQKTDNNAYLMLVGYIQKHKEICPEHDCPLKVTKPSQSDASDEKETIIRLIRVIERLYISGTKKFKKSVKLRISYAFFLLERLNMRKKALEELMIAETLDPNFEDQFFIYRYKKIIEDRLGDQTGGKEEDETEIDIVGLIAFKTHLTMCIHFVKQAAETQKLYWSELLEDKPMIENLNKIGNQIDFQIRKAQENWSKLSKMNANAPLIIKLYSKFLSGLLNDKHNANQLLEFFYEIIEQNQRQHQNDFSDLQKINTSNAVSIVKYNAKTPGIFENANGEFCAMFGYNKDYLLTKSLDLIFPDLYTNYKSNFLNCLLESKITRMFSNYEIFWN
jgi:hypothetical protein